MVQHKERVASSAKKWLLWLCLAFLLTGCTNFFAKGLGSSANVGTGSVSVSFGSASSAKTVAASSSDLMATVANLAVAVVDGSGKTVAGSTISYNAGTNATYYGITPGSYAIEVLAYNASGSLVAKGSLASQSVTSGGTLSCTVSLSFSISQTATGGFSLIVQWPSSLSKLSYIRANLDGGASSAQIYAGNGTIGTSYYSATISQSGLSSGQHILYLYFQNSASDSSNAQGPFIEVVNIWDGTTSTAWLDSSGVAQSALTLSANSFLSTDALLKDLSIGAVSMNFSPVTYSYSPTSNFTSTALNFTATADVGAQALGYTWNGASGSWSGIAGSVFTTTSLPCVSGANTLVLAVTAPDRSAVQSYTVTINCGAAGLTFSPNPCTNGLGLPASGGVTQNQAYTLSASTASSALSGVSTGWSWYVDGVPRPQNAASSFFLSPSETLAMLGTYTITGSVVGSDGVNYSGRTSLTVNRMSSLSLSQSSVAVSTLIGTAQGSTFFKLPVAMASDGSNIYVADYATHTIIKLSKGTSGWTASTLAGSGLAGYDQGSFSAATFKAPNGIAITGDTIYVSDSGGTHAIRKLSLDSSQVTDFVPAGFLSAPAGLATDGQYLYVADSMNHVVRKYSLSSGASPVMTYGSGSESSENGAFDAASFVCPGGLALVGTNLYVSDASDSNDGITANYIRKIDLTTGNVSTLSLIVDLVSRTSYSLNGPSGLATDGSNLYIAEAGNNRISEVSLATGVAATLAGTGTAGSGDGGGSSATLNTPRSILIVGSALYVLEADSNLDIRELQ